MPASYGRTAVSRKQRASHFRSRPVVWCSPDPNANPASIKSGTIQGVHHDEKGDSFDVTSTVDEVSASDYDGLVRYKALRGLGRLAEETKVDLDREKLEVQLLANLREHLVGSQTAEHEIAAAGPAGIEPQRVAVEVPHLDGGELDAGHRGDERIETERGDVGRIVGDEVVIGGSDELEAFGGQAGDPVGK